MKNVFSKLLCALPFLGFASCETTNDVNTTAVTELDLTRYAGSWYEVARYDHRFERGLVGCMAQYNIDDDGTIQVLNTGYRDSLDGEFKESEGKARRPDASKPGELEVSFFLSFYSPYKVLELADDYRYALVGSKNDKYLWILSRTPQLTPADESHLLQCAQQRGYDINKLIWVIQPEEEW